ncbi:MAG: 30S ribosomal protein S16 [Bdellovibrionales bacterium]|nr:30S ribosomal protein S16 [Bdellovibrionales bacterium]
MVVIRLSRCGARHRPKYRVTVADSRRSATGCFIEIIGQYDSNKKEKKEGFKVDIEKYKQWVVQGAQPSQTLRSLVKKVYSI